ncbi:CHD5-like protein-domain-containing protein [Xylaria bambusicola]|uniref:CHD5-like protein-domain-containing protein n=1 Tax=Xylaria bambusicola TaxID=326684 RepID=UPI002008739D|nr:CHD5-like protein-domain-containing protein [Xylaria bambusicola]KAI0513216.1 CHD5-like protein-domain-containing protein [Xylaria bambusicola]
MPSLLLVVLLVEVVVHLVNTIGATAINDVLWNIYLALPTKVSKQADEKNKLQKEYLAIRRDLKATSSQDQFAKWAKLRRQHDKQLEQLEKMKASHDASKANFDRTAGIIRWCATSGVKFIMPWIYGTEPMFWLPSGWFPYYVEWVLSFPRAPLGSISIVSWQTACAAAVLLFSDAIKAILLFALGSRSTQKQPMTSTTGGADIKALLIFFGPILLPKAIGYYRRFKASSKSPTQQTGALSPGAIRAISIFCSLALVFFIFALPPFATENIFYRTASRLQAPTDVLFSRLATLRPGEALTNDDTVLRSKFVNLESRLLYLQYGPDVLISCPFCSSEDPNTYWFYAAPSILKPYIFNLFALSIATSTPFADAGVSRWRSFASTTTVAIAIIELWTTAAYERAPNAKATRYTDIEVLFQLMQTARCLALGILNVLVAALIWLSATGRMFARPPSPAARVESVIRQLLTTKSKLSAVGIVKNTSLRDDDLRGRIEDYWTHEGKLMREVMEEREVVEGINDALTRINIRDIMRDAEQYAFNMFPKPPEPPEIVIRSTG